MFAASLSLPSVSSACVAPHLRCLRFVGFCRNKSAAASIASSPDVAASAISILLRAYHIFALVATSMYVLIQLIYAYQERDDMEKLSRVLFVMLCHVTCVAKQVVFYADADRIDELIVSLDDPLFNQPSGCAPFLLSQTARQARVLLVLYAGGAGGTCALWAAFAALDRARDAAATLPFWFPFEYAHPAQFTMVLLYSFYSTNLVAIGNTTMDAFVATILNLCKTQLRILRNNLETLSERASTVATTSGGAYDKVLYKLLVECLEHYRKITELCELLQDIFGAALLVQFAVGGWILCMAAYKIVSLDILSIEFASTTLFIACILTELFLYCYYGNELTVESNLVSTALFATRWEERRAGRRVARALLVAGERARRPLRPAAAARLVPLTLDTYLKILKSSYSFYAVLRQTKSSSGRSVSIHLQLLRWCGYCRLPPPSPSHFSLFHWMHEVYRVFILTLTVTYLLQECVYAYQERCDMDKLARAMFLLLCHVTSIAKQLVFHMDADRIDRMIVGLDDPLLNQPEARAQALVVASRRWWSRFVRGYAGVAALTCTMWAVFPVLYRAQGLPVDFPLWTNMDYSRTSRFLVVLGYTYFVNTLEGIANTTMDALVATVLDQCKTQLKILRLNFECLTSTAACKVAGNSKEAYDKVLMQLFLECLKHFEMINKTTTLLQEIFSISILIQFAIGGWILCMAAYKVVNLSILSIEFASMILFTSCIFIELFLYCYYGNEVTVESSQLADSMYMMRWESTSVWFRRALLVARERARRPLRPAAGRVIPLSIETFLKILKSSYTFYAVLRQTK